jgi:hypothetical protein
VKAAILPLIAKDAGMVAKARALVRGARGRSRRVRRGRRDRPPLPPPGRDRHAVRVHDRRADARGRHRHDPRPRLARPGAALDLTGRRPARGRAAQAWTSPKGD